MPDFRMACLPGLTAPQTQGITPEYSHAAKHTDEQRDTRRP
jgi:hypothetical protein